MCGIVGYIGNKNAVDVVLEGLTRLEYRGYDSAGVAYPNSSNEIEYHKKAGKIDILKNHLKGFTPESNLSIGHTRWATHGGVNDTNAHPHTEKNIAIVHNGIIENHAELKDELISQGISFKSDTDSEVFIHLVVRELDKNKPLVNAVGEAFKLIKGNSAFVVLNSNSKEIVCIKRSAPLVCGRNNQTKELLASSDPYALVGFADDLYFPENEVIVRLFEKEIQFFDLDANPTDKYTRKGQMMNLQTSEKGEFEHFMIKEIHEQPNLIRALFEFYNTGKGRILLDQIVKAVDVQRLHIVACGTAYHAGLVIKEFFEKNNKLYTFVELASEFRYREPLLKPKDGGIFISQSGETADTLAAQELVKKANLPTLSIVNVEGSTLFRSCDYNLLINAGFEIGVASTKAFTQQVLTGYLLSKAENGEIESPTIKSEMLLLADRMEELLNKSEDIKKIAEELHTYKGYIFTGRGKYYPIAFEGALKLKEIAYVHAEGYASGELKHGPIALIDEDMVNVAVVGPELYDKTVSNVEEVKARRGVILSVGPENDKNLQAISDHYIPINFDGLSELSPLLVNLALQLFSYYLALFKGTDIDKPRNLAKSVTVE